MKSEYGMRNVLAIGAHPDDVEFGCGGTLIKHLQAGDKVTIVHMSCSDCENIDGRQIRKADTSRAEALAAAEVIGADCILLPFKDQEIPFNRESIFAIERLIVDRKIDTVYTHWSGDSHQDHINTLRSVLAAARHVDRIFLYEQVPLPRVGNISAEVNYYVDISAQYKQKEAACLKHESQVDQKYEDTIIKGARALAEYRGCQCNCMYAEAFDAVKVIER